MTRLLRTPSLAALLTVLSLLVTPAARATETEVREFTIEIDSKNAGMYAMTITKQNDGILSVETKANITFKYYALLTYKYTYHGVEHWKDGRLLQLTSNCNDDGKKTEVIAMAEKDSLRLKVNGHERVVPRWDSWTTTYWMLADSRFHNKAIPLLDADTGKEYLGQLKYVGREILTIGGKQQTCYHFQVTGGPTSPCDLWYDGAQRLVRQELTDQGRHVVFVLSAVRR